MAKPLSSRGVETRAEVFMDCARDNADRFAEEELIWKEGLMSTPEEMLVERNSPVSF